MKNILILLCFICFSCSYNPANQQSANIPKTPNTKSISILLWNNNILTFNYTKLSYTVKRNRLLITTISQDTAISMETIHSFAATSDNNLLDITLYNIGTLQLNYNLLYFNDRNIFSVVSANKQNYYGIETVYSIDTY